MKIGKIAVNILGYRINRINLKKRKKFVGLNDYSFKLDEPYINDGSVHHQMDIFLAKENRNNICVIDIHGGAYILCEHRDNFPLAYKFVEKGFDFITIDYLPNDGKRTTKDLLDDCYICIKYIYEHLKDYHIENDTFVITGDSAGGHFALVIAEAADDKEYAERLGYNFDGIDFKVALLNCPVFDFVNLGKDALRRSGNIRLFGKDYDNVEARQLICPKYNFKSLKTPLFVSTCHLDFLRNESMMLKECLETFPYPHRFVDINSHKKKVNHSHNVLRPNMEESVKVNSEMMDFIYEIIPR